MRNDLRRETQHDQVISCKTKSHLRGLDIAVDVAIKRKQPYADKIEEYCQKCRCKADK